jgi:hypothetical protein
MIKTERWFTFCDVATSNELKADFVASFRRIEKMLLQYVEDQLLLTKHLSEGVQFELPAQLKLDPATSIDWGEEYEFYSNSNLPAKVKRQITNWNAMYPTLPAAFWARLSAATVSIERNRWIVTLQKNRN